MSSKARPVWLIAGPTASGKSALALRLARAIGGEIVNADSMQIYRDLRLLTARPTPAEEALAPHHLYGIAEAAEAWSAGRWLRAALETLAAIGARRRTAIVVGGTGLYFRALTSGLAPVPPTSGGRRAQAQALIEAIGETAFRARLADVDPRSAARIGPGDRQRLTRAFEVFAATGRALSAWQADTSPPLAAGAWRSVVLSPPRDELRRRCDARLVTMLADGALDEVRVLMARGLSPALPAMKAVGVRALRAHLAGEIDLAQALAKAQAETRRLAKRQTTWLRHQASSWPRIEAAEPDQQWEALRALFGV